MLKFLLKLKKISSILISFLLVFELTFSPLISLFFERDTNEIIVSAQTTPEIYFSPYPRAPQRIIFYLRKMENTIDELVNLNKNLKKSLKWANCKYALSQCIPSTPAMGITKNGEIKCIGGISGQPYQNPEEIKKYKEEIKEKIEALSYQRKLLEEEIKSHTLECELKSLRSELAEELKDEINKALEKSDKIISKAQETEELYNKDYTKNCIVSCKQDVCGFKACFRFGTGPQKNISIKAKVGVGLNDLNLGKVSIDKFRLVLPDKIKFSQLGDILLNIPSQTVPVCSSSNQVNLLINPPSFNNLPNMEFSCPSFSTPTPTISIFKLPEKIQLPSLVSSSIDWCKPIQNILTQTLTSISYLQQIDQEISKLKKIIDEKTDEIEKQIQNTPTKSAKNAFKKVKNEIQNKGNEAIGELQNKSNEIKNQISNQSQTPSKEVNFSSQSSKTFNYQTSTNFNLPSQNISLSYQCSQQGTTKKKIKTSAATNWYFKKLNWLMNECSNLPTMKITWSPGKQTFRIKTENCYNPQKVIQTINEECDKYWNINYCKHSFSAPSICSKIRYNFKSHGCHGYCGCEISKKTSTELAAAVQCQNLFKQEKENSPSSCDFSVEYIYVHGRHCYKIKLTKSPNFNPIKELQNKCEQLQNKYPQEPPEPCKLLPLFTGKLSPPPIEEYSPSTKRSCPAQTLLNIPFGFGGGIGFNCNLGTSGLPKISLPDIVIPDIIGPRFGIPPFFEIKLPSIITEDLRLPDINLCDLSECSNIFPSLNFNFLQFNLPSFDASAPIPNLNSQLTGRINFPTSIRFALPPLNLFNLIAPELSLPKISLPEPKLTFAITGIDTSAIFDLIFTFILNALGVPNNFGGCLTFSIPSSFLSITFPDYYFSFKKFPKIPKIPYCDDINGFCKDVKESLGENGWLKKAKKIESIINDNINKIQEKIDNSVRNIKTEIKNQINEIFKEYAGIISNEIKKQLKVKGLSIQDYINSETRKLNLNEIPFPGILPVGEDNGIKGGKTGKCLYVSLPERNIILRITNPKKIPQPNGTTIEKKGEITIEKTNNGVIIYTPLDIPSEKFILWPNNIKSSQTTNPINYDIPSISLSKISYEKEFSIKGPGFQPYNFNFNFGPSNGNCIAEPPRGGNPIPIIEIESKIDKIKDLQNEFKNASQIIKNILE